MSFLRKRRIIKDLCREGTSKSEVATSPGGWEHEVFLSFHGPDTRRSFTDYLYNDLVCSGVVTFRDSEGLRVGETIGPKLIEAIRCSRISIAILSCGYASSKWCLVELDEIVKCSETRRQIIIPIFYYVKPTDVRNQSGSYEGAFLDHEKEFSREEVQSWRAALKKVGNLKGLEVEKTADGHQGELVKLIVPKVLKDLKKGHLNVTDHLVGTEHHVTELLRRLDANSDETTRIVGIYGIGGIGKTTLGKVVYNELLDLDHRLLDESYKWSAHKFDSWSYLESIKDKKDLRDLQSQLINDILKPHEFLTISSTDDGVKMIQNRFRSKRVLILLDDVDHQHQLLNLARRHDWFGKGSKIIITTRDKSALESPDTKVDSYYDLRELNYQHSLQLFSKHAFRMDYPPKDYLLLCQRFMFIVAGLPLALEVLGSSLNGESIEVWYSKLTNAKSKPIKEVAYKLKITYDGLTQKEQEIFLDVACFLIGRDADIALYFWRTPEYDPIDTILRLMSMSLIEIGEDFRFKMHDQLMYLGRSIADGDYLNERSVSRNPRRVWKTKDAYNLLWNKQGTAEVEALRFAPGSETLLDSKYYAKFSDESFRGLSNLKFLELRNSILEGNFHGLLKELRWFQWTGCTVKDGLTDFSLDNLVILDMTWSGVSESWSVWQLMKGKQLKVFNLSHSRWLVATPDLSAYTALERLILEKCYRLRTIHESIGQLSTLSYLNLRRCGMLKTLPQGFRSLQALKELLIDGSGIQELCTSEIMTKLEIISATGCPLARVDCSIGHLPSLEKLVLDQCHNLESLPSLPSSLTDLRVMWEGTGLRFPTSINLKQLCLSWSTEQLQSVSFSDLIQAYFSELDSLTFSNVYVTSLLAEFTAFSRLTRLIVRDCTHLKSLSDFPSASVLIL